jgi:phosphohistidine swiveling domain-containing protein
MIVHMHDPHARDAAITGGKGSSLAVLAELTDVPPFFCITSKAFSLLFSDSETQSLIAELQVQTEWAQIDAASKRLRKHIKRCSLPVEVEKEIIDAYAALCQDPNASVAVRSSATTEDLVDASFAGQHSTYLNQRGAENVVRSVKKCWASVFNSRAAEYRNKHQISHSAALLCVVVQQMIEPVVAGTAFSVELATGFPGLNVSVVWGCGEGLVSGDVTADDWLFAGDGSLRLIRRMKGSKKGRFQSALNGIEFVPNPPEMQKQFCLDTATARSIASKLTRIHEYYRDVFHYEHIDTELAVDSQQRLFFLQCRPVVPVERKAILTVEEGHLEDVIVSGRYSLPGAVVGRINCVTFESLANGTAAIGEGDIVVAVKTGNAWTPFLKTLRGLVTEEGSPTSHPMLIGRERGLVVLVGVPAAVETLGRYHGELVTLDGLKKRVYIGEQTLKSACAAELQRRFAPPPPPVLQTNEESRTFLRNFSRGFLDEDGSTFWCALAEHPSSPFWADLHAASLQERLPILRRCSSLVDAALLCNDVRFEPARDGSYRVMVYDRLMPIEQTMSLFVGVDAAALVKDRDLAVAEYLAACSEFAKSGTAAAFERYAQAWKVFFAHKWLSWFFRTHLEHQLVREAIRLNVAEMHLDLLLETEQSRLVDIDLDLSLYREIKRLATFDTVDERELRALARSFKAGKCTDIAEEPPSRILAMKIAQRREQRGMATAQAQLLVSGEFADVDPLGGTELYPEDDCADLRAAVAITVLARRQHCNSHHLLMKGQWPVRDKLVALFGKRFYESKSFVF